MKAKDIMTPNPIAVTPDDSVVHAAEIMRVRGLGMLPVVDSPSKMRLRGIITDRDITIRCTASGHATGCKVKHHMSVPPLETVSSNDDVSAVAEHMERRRVRRVPVVENGDHLIGVIAQADLATKVGRENPQLIEELIERISTASLPV
jgi:CBS domain-containing protein